MISAQTLCVCREEKPLHTFPDHALRPERQRPGRAGVAQGGDEIFVALALEFLLRRLEARDARRDLGALLRQPFLLLFCEAHPVLRESLTVPRALASRIGARLRKGWCRIVICTGAVEDLRC